MEMPHPQRRTEELHKGRISVPEARYFVTLVTQRRESWLADPVAAKALQSTLIAWHDERDGAILAATIMPDHAHILFQLGHGLTVGQCVARWKTSARKAIAYHHDWLRDFYEHHLRPNEPIEDYALYIFLNPYRARLIPPDLVWPWWLSPNPTQFLFSAMLGDSGAPPAEWIGWPAEKFSHLATGE